jgi:hypothetical protein
MGLEVLLDRRNQLVRQVDRLWHGDGGCDSWILADSICQKKSSQSGNTRRGAEGYEVLEAEQTTRKPMKLSKRLTGELK